MTALRKFAAFAWAVCILVGTPADAQGISQADYQRLERQLDGRIRFEILPQRPEPGFNLDAPLREGRATLGESFAGLSLPVVTDRRGGRFDGLGRSAPQVPLRVIPGAPGANLSIAYHRGLGSNALFPLGPAGFPALAARGEGAVALLFDHDQPALGLVVHTDYPDPLGADTGPRGGVTLRFFARDGRVLGTVHHRPPRGRSSYGYVTSGGAPIAGVMIVNTDPGGIAIDDILYALVPPLG